MNRFSPSSLLLMILAAALAGCAMSTTKAADVSGGIRISLDQAGFKDVSVTQDRDKGVVTLGGHVTAESDKVKAENIAKSQSGNQVVADEIAVVPPGSESETKAVNSNLDQGIERNMTAALIKNKYQEGVKVAVKNQVITLSGEVDAQAAREDIQRIAAGVPYVKQVVNELQVRHQKATTTN